MGGCSCVVGKAPVSGTGMILRRTIKLSRAMSESLPPKKDAEGVEISALFACPFCGAGPEHLKHEEVPMNHWRIACFLCSARGPTVHGKHELDMEVSLLTGTKAATGPMGGWNMRNGWDPSHPNHPMQQANANMEAPNA